MIIIIINQKLNYTKLILIIILINNHNHNHNNK